MMLDLDPTLPPLRVQELAPVLAVSDDVIYRAIAAGEIKALRLGRAIRISRTEVARLLGIDGDPAA